MKNNESPAWLNKPLLIEILKSVEEGQQHVEVVKYQCQNAVPPGTNYLSEVYRVMVEYKTRQTEDVKKIPLFFKIPLPSTGMREFVDNGDGYQKEIKFYNEVLPTFYEVHNSRVTPRSFPCPLDSSLVLEDLGASGYKLSDRLKQLDVPHCRQVMKTLAKFHALSVAAHHRYPKVIENTGKHLIYDDESTEKEKREKVTFTVRMMNGMVETLAKLEGCQRYVQMIDKMKDSYWERIVQLKKSTKAFNVLLHGDSWTTNILFKYNNEGEVIDAKIVDFQQTQYSSFTIDLMFFWFSSANENVRDHHKEEMFEVYRQTMNTILQELQCTERLSKEDFDRDMKVFAPFAISVMFTVLPYAMADPTDLLDFKNMSFENFCRGNLDDSPQMKYLKSKYYRALFPKLLKHAEEFGAFK